ncbi:MAG: LptF/LptG family permease [Candidatus Latescibacteria bacterium]|nr:LptF/LptG family permease [Candidatus Latescibacterota bacterium]
MNIFHRYVIREHIVPFLFAFFVIMFVLILKLMLDMMELLISKGVGVVVLAKLLVYNLAWMVALVIPMSVLVAAVMAFGRMGANNEITAMKTAGISMYRILSPVFLLTVLLTCGMVWFNNVVLPEANYRAGSLRGAILRKKPLLSLKNREGQFIRDDGIPFTFRVKEIDDRTEVMHGVMLFRREDNDQNTIIVAETGRFITGGERLELLLSNGEIHRRDPGREDRYVRSSFDRFVYIIKDLQFGLDTSYRASRNDRNMTSGMMRGKIAELHGLISSWEKRLETLPENEPDRAAQIRNIEFQIRSWRHRISEYQVEIHKKNSIPVAALVFVLIGASLGMLVRRSGVSIGIGMSIGFFTLYYMFLIAGENIADRMIIEPWLAMWLPNIILGPVGAALFVHAARR